MSGKLIFSVSHRIEEIDLSKKKRSLLYEANQSNIYNYLNWKGNNEYVVENYHIIKGYQIEVIDITNGRNKVLAKGSRPLYLGGKIIYIDGNELLIKPVAVEQVPKILSKDVHKYSKAPLRISDREVAYYDFNNKIAIFNLDNGATHSLGKTHCIPWAFIPVINSFVCKSEKNGAFYLLNERSDQNLEKMFIDGAKLGVRENMIISADGKHLIYSKVRKISLSEKQDVYLYDLTQKKEFKYLDDVTITSGVTVK